MEKVNNSCGKKKGCHADDGLPFDILPVPMYSIVGSILSGVLGARDDIWQVRALAPGDTQAKLAA